MSKAVTLYEFEPLLLSDPKIESLGLNFLNSFDNYLECTFTERPILISRDRIVPKSYVGTIFFKGTQFEILPKLLGSEDLDTTNRVCKNLLTILSVTRRLKVSITEIQGLKTTRLGLLEIYIQLFVTTLERQLALGAHRNYVSTESNLNCVKGRIDFQEQIKTNIIHKEKTYCRFDEFSENNELNKLLKSITRALLGLTKEDSNFSKLKAIDSCLSEVDLVHFTPERADKIQTSRLTMGYETPLSIAKLLIRGLSPETRAGKTRQMGILFDMNRLFEEFVFEALSRHQDLHGCQVTAQKKTHLSIAYRDSNEAPFITDKSFGTRSDIQVRFTDGSLAIIDTKYKVLNPKELSLGVSPADAYQILAYASICSKENLKVLPILLYPHPTFDYGPNIMRTFKTSGVNGQTFHVMTTSLFDDLSQPYAVRNLANDIFRTCKELP